MTTPLQNADPTATANVGSPTALAPAEPQAQGGAASIDPATRAAIVKEAHDSFFAEARRMGLFDKSSKKPTAATAPEAAPPAAVDLRHLDRALSRSGLGASLSDTAYQRMERAFQTEAPERPDDWVKEYLGGFGVAAPQTPPPSQIATAPARVGPPASDGGAPPPSRVPLEQQDILRMSEGDRAALVKQIGPAEFSRRLLAQASGKTYRIG